MITFHSHSGIYTLVARQIIETGIDEAWEFFSSPANLRLITPPEMGFVITSPAPSATAYHGQIISYKLHPVGKIKTNWVTEITHVSEKKFFVDEQRKGPYRMWHHEHHFKDLNGRVEMTDRVTYRLPLGVLGKLVHNIFVKQKLREIFVYRKMKIEEIFKS
ncbi:SRPBCC family protein [Prolixibacter sp. NT017]|uniref:SRPBCC family protein n=1 Tax=Prolixibacter sp. NT017 TaxID=2652390 RepID=UPI001289D07D|nr:SRPBCC family protein [Prolixibacter sp. NT017]GET25762.1 hypothetical protein NT017_20910 [Prolixibacter sp. NT017]